MHRRIAIIVVLAGGLAEAHHPEEPFAAPGTEPFELMVGFESPQACFECHRGVDLPERVAPGDTWAGSMHANSFRDPVFQAALTVANQDHLDAGSFCLRCHTPVGWLDGRSLPGNGSALNAEQQEGITCAFCHRLDEGRDRMTPGPLIGQGSYYIHDEARYRGPYADAPSLHPTVRDDYVGSSEACGICHSVSSPNRAYLDPQTEEQLAPVFPEQRTYEEWAASAFADEGVGCIDCHMPRRVGRLANVPDAPLRAGVRSHGFAGANTFVPRVLQAEGPPERAADYAWAEARAREMLRSSATLAATGWPTTVDPAAPLPLVVRVVNETGHKLPTGYPEGRRMWLEVEAWTDDEAPYFASGVYDHEAAELVADPQLRTYEVVQTRTDGGPAHHLLLNDTILLDTRIPPRGFTAAVDTWPVGAEDYRTPEGAWLHYDDAPYTLPAPPADAEVLHVRVRLLYQSISRDMVESLRDANHSDARGDRLYALWEAHGRAAPEEVAVMHLRARLPDRAAAGEICNGLDDDVDGVADEGPEGGGFGAETCGVGACERAVPRCVDGEPTDCTPGPAGREFCNGLDDDCDGAADEALRPVLCGVGICARQVPACLDGEPVACVAGEPEPETCDGEDDDCDNAVDEGFGEVSCGVGACRRVVARCAEGALQRCEAGAPVDEVCDGLDNDCDGATDEDIAPLACAVGGCEWVVPGCVDGAPSDCADGSPDSPEVCNGDDDDCDGEVDEGFPVETCGVGACVRAQPTCELGVPKVCAPGDPLPEACNGADDDCDGAVDEALPRQRCGLGLCVRVVDACAEGVPLECVPGPAAPETCDGRDEDCDGEADEELGTRECGVGACARTVPACVDGARQPCVPGPAAREDCNGVDDDCDGAVDEALGTRRCGEGDCAREVVACVDGAWADCEPGAPGAELCGGGDEDCDGVADEGFEVVARCGVGACARQVAACDGQAPGECVPGQPGEEVCGGGDEDCDGAVDEGLGELSCGVGECARRAPACEQGQPGQCVPGPASVEVCGGGDEDCDGAVDEALGATSCGVGACARTVASCADGVPVACEPGAPAVETCDGVDEDCDGTADERLGDVTCGVGACARLVPACQDGSPVECQPGAPIDEVCGGDDEDCDGVIDEGCEPEPDAAVEADAAVEPDAAVEADAALAPDAAVEPDAAPMPDRGPGAPARQADAGGCGSTDAPAALWLVLCLGAGLRRRRR